MSSAGCDATDGELVHRAAHGDGDALAVLVQRHTPRVYGICLRYFGNPEDAEDAVQETFLTLLRRADTFEGRARLSTWLYRVATNTCNDIARARARRPRTSELRDHHAPLDRAVEDALAARELDTTLVEALSQLDEGQRRAVILHDVAGWPLAEIAAADGVAVGTVKSRIHRGHARLADVLAPQLEATGSPPPTTSAGEPIDPPRPPTSG